MSSVDHRIVEMEFDNKQFEKGVSTTINSIDELKKSLEFKGVEKGFDNISKGLSGIGFDKVSGALDAVTSKFSIFGTIGDQVIRSLTNSVTSKLLVAFKEVGDMLTGISYSTEGFKEYELKIGSIQTIAANTGALSTLNKETEKFIEYSEEELEVANKVVQGYYSVGSQRKQMIEALGYDYEKIQNKVDEIVSGVNGEITASGNNVKTTLADIDVALDDLNVYADKTIYNFSNMTQAIGKFTTAGIDLETSVEAVKGVSNLAALSGADNAANQRAMYNISQALQVGYMQLMDWRSIENAGMASAQFKEAIMETARVHGIDIDKMIKEEGSFNLTLQKKWLTNDILIESLAKLTAFTEDMTEEEREAERARWKEIGYTDEQISAIEDLSRVAYESATKVRTFSQLVSTLKEEVGSSYTMMWQNIVGNFDEATNLWTGLHDAIQDNFLRPMAEARDAKWKFFHDNGGREAAIEGLTNVGKGLLTIIHAITDAWKEVFPPDDGHRITAIAKAFAEFSKKLIVSEETAEKIKMTFKGLFAALHIVINLIKAISGPIIKLLSIIGPKLLNVTAAIGEFIVKLDEFIEKNGVFEAILEVITKILSKIFSVLGSIINAFSNASSSVAGFVKNIIDDIGLFDNLDISGIEDVSNRISKAFSKAFSHIVTVFEKIRDLLVKVISFVKPIFVKIFNFIKPVIISLASAIKNGIGDITFGDLILMFLGANTVGTIGKTISGAYGSYKSMLKLFDNFKNLAKTLNNLFSKIGKLSDSFVGVLNSLKDVLSAYATDIKADALKKIAISILFMAAALVALSFIDYKNLIKGIVALTIILTELVIAMKIISEIKFSSKTIISSVLLLLALSVALLALAPIIMLFGVFNKQAEKGIQTITELLVVLIAGLKAIDLATNSINLKQLISSLLLIFTVVGAVLLLMPPILILALLPKDKVDNAITSLVKILGILMVTLALTAVISRLSNIGNLIATITVLEGLVFAINMLMIPILLLSLLRTEKIVSSIVAIGSILAILISSVYILSKIDDNKKAIKNIRSLAITLIMISAALKIVGSIDTENIMWSTIALSALMLILIAAVAKMDNIKSSDKAVANIRSLATSVAALGGALALIGRLGPDQLLYSVLALSALLMVLMKATDTMGDEKEVKKKTKVLTRMALSITILSYALGNLAKAEPKKLLAASAALSGLLIVFALVGKKLGTSSMKGLQNLAKAMNSFSMAAIKFSVSLYLIAAALRILSTINFDDANYTGLPSVLTDIIIGLKEVLPQFISFIGEVIKSIFSFMEEVMPEVVRSLLIMIEDILVLLNDRLPIILPLIGKIIVTILSFLDTYVEPITDLLISVILKVINAITANMQDIVKAAFDFVISILDGITTILADDERRREMENQIKLLIAEIILIIGEFTTDFLLAGIELIKELAIGIGKGVKRCASAIKDVIVGAKNIVVDKANEIWNSIKEIGKFIIEGIWEGIKSAKEWLEDKISGFCEGIVDTFGSFFKIKSPSKLMRDEIGIYIGQGIGEGINNSERYIDDEINKFNSNILSNFENIKNPTVGISPVIDMDKNMTPYMDDYGTNAIVSISSDKNFDELYSKGISTDITNRMTMDVSDQMDQNQQDILETTNNIYSELASLRGYISEIKIQLDSGALVGSLVGPMDTALGERSAMKGRGV